MNDLFLACLRITEKAEGGWSNDPKDPGGATMVGVTLNAWRSFMHDQRLTPQQLHDMTEPARRIFYYTMYWNPMRADDLPAGINLIAFDTAVNCGVHAASIMLQKATNMPVNLIDGYIGPTTIAWVNKANIMNLLWQFSSIRQNYYRALENFPYDGRGWLARVQTMLIESDAMIHADDSKQTSIS